MTVEAAPVIQDTPAESAPETLQRHQDLPPLPPEETARLNEAMNLSPEARKFREDKLAKKAGTAPAPQPTTQTPSDASKPSDAKPKFILDPDETTAAPESKPPVVAPAKDAIDPEKIVLDAKDPKAVHAFATLTREVKELRKQLAERPAPEQYTKQIEELTALVEKTNLIESPRFKARHDAKIQAKASEVLSLAKEWGVDEALVKDALGQGLKARSEALGAIEPEAKLMLLNAMREFDGERTAKQQAVENWMQSKQQMEQEEAGMLLQSRTKISDHVLAAARDNGVSLLVPREGNETWNKQAAQFETKFRAVVGSKNPVEQGAFILRGVLCDVFEDAYLSTSQELKKLKAELAARNGSRPTPTMGGDRPTPSGTRELKPMSAEQIAQAVTAKHADAWAGR